MAVGKTTAAKIFENELKQSGYFVNIFPFAAAVKKAAKECFGLTDEDIKEKDSETRRILQGLGSFGRNQVARNFWISKNEEKIKSFMVKENCVILIDDVRFYNEIEWIRDFFDRQYVFYIRRSNSEEPEDLHSQEMFLSAHESETEIESVYQTYLHADVKDNSGRLFNLVIENNSTLKVFEAGCRKIADMILFGVV